MSWLPVFAAELAAYEARIGIRLPEFYRVSLQDAGIHRILTSPGIAALRPGHTMQRFAALGDELRRLQTGFPADGVVLHCGTREDGEFELGRGYLRFWLPDRRHPDRLGDTVYAWDLVRHRKTRDCSVQQWIDSTIDCADEALLRELGVAKPNVFPRPALQAEPCDPLVRECLGLRGPAAAQCLESLGGAWLPCAQFEVFGRHVTVCDAGRAPTTETSLRVTPGSYDVSLRLAFSVRRDGAGIAGVRMLRRDAVPDARRRVFAVDVDHAAVGLFDRQTFFARVRDRESFATELVRLGASPCRVATGGKGHAVVVPSGAGDGTYPVFELRRGEETVGLEIEFEASRVGA